MIVNGQSENLTAEISLTDYLNKNNYRLNLIVVERNGIIMPKKDYDSVILTDADTLEIVSFVGGG